MSVRALGLGLWLACLAGCAVTAQQARSQVDRSRIAYAQQITAAQRAPQPYQRFEQASQAAAKSPEGSAARGDYQAEARLWLETAIAETERERLSERRLAEERKLIQLDATVGALERERESWAREAELRAARALASNEARKALVRAAERPSLRVKLPREDVKLAAEALLARAELVGLTLDSLGIASAGLARLRAKIDDAAALLVRDPEASLARADTALFYGLSLFAVLRGQDGGPSQDEKATLAEELTSAGVRPTRGDQGLVGVLDRAFADYALVPSSERVLERLCELAKAHPRGAVLLSVHAKSPKQAEVRIGWVRQRFSRAGCEGQRFTIASAKADGDALEAHWVAY